MIGSLAFAGKLYRALNPRWAADPLSGAGAAVFGGRFNARGMAALYCSLSPLTALREANQVGDLQPTLLVCYRAELERLFDARDAAALAVYGLTPELLADPGWRLAMRGGGEAATQALARQLTDDGYCGMLVRSFARGAAAEDLNLVLWRWGNSPPAVLEVIDDEGRLSSASSP